MIEVRDLSLNLKGFSLSQINLRVNPGEYFVILGPTGCGKTVLLETIVGLYHPDQGRIWVGGREVTDLPPEKRQIGFVYQDYALFPHMSVARNIGFGLKSEASRIDQMADLLGISHLLHRYPKNLSGGEQQKVALGRALVREPRALLLDEPLSALDPNSREGTREELKNIAQKLGSTTVHVTHDFEEALFLGDRIGVMNEGMILQVGSPEDVFRRPNCEFVANFTGAKNLFKGRIKIVDGLCRVDTGKLKIEAVTNRRGQVYLSVRPEDILLSTGPIKSSARNNFRGRITQILEKGALVQVMVDVGEVFAVLVTKLSLDEMKLKVGLSAFISFKASAVNVF